MGTLARRDCDFVANRITCAAWPDWQAISVRKVKSTDDGQECPSYRRELGLHQYLLDHMAVHIGQAALDAVVIKAQLLMIEAEQVQRGRMQVVAVAGILGSFESQVIARAITRTAFDAAAGQPRGEGAGIVVASLLSPLHERLTAELAGADD